MNTYTINKYIFSMSFGFSWVHLPQYYPYENYDSYDLFTNVY